MSHDQFRQRRQPGRLIRRRPVDPSTLRTPTAASQRLAHDYATTFEADEVAAIRDDLDHRVRGLIASPLPDLTLPAPRTA
ncbi:hypothetical protein [Pseudofrankia asymbiotica]|uniref:Uncharacterized protein n=1 Tax=Pseudofrankia asymbiotica TaxID=1834516 RepID=A0A1V2IHX3_9ACTN|nr:hypothetical protein [Pseudofrankia asymbiotica]ONH32635.1 hypothetical protein BL253_04840 [Pseudofrankia asymbiotica]